MSRYDNEDRDASDNRIEQYEHDFEQSNTICSSEQEWEDYWNDLEDEQAFIDSLELKPRTVAYRPMTFAYQIRVDEGRFDEGYFIEPMKYQSL